MKEFVELKSGDKLYSLSYFNDEREWQTVTVKQRKGRALMLKGGYEWRVTEKMYGSKFFPSKAEAIEHAIEQHELRFDEISEEYAAFKKEIVYLKRKLQKLKAENGQEKPTTDGIPPTPKGAGILPTNI